MLILLLAAAVPAACGGDTGGGAATPASDTAAGASTNDTPGESITIEDVGFETPESVLYDEEAGVYLVSNVNGGPLDHDDNGFISRVDPDGTVKELRWVDAQAREDVRLDAPKGMVLKGDTLFVADIDTVRAFQRETGDPLTARAVPGATFLNDMAAGPDGTVYVSDSGAGSDSAGSGAGAIWAMESTGPREVVSGAGLARPNGITVAADTLFYVTMAAAELRRVPTAGGAAPEVVATLPGGQLDGLVRLDDGSFLISSWEAQAVFRVRESGGAPERVVDDVPSPAGIGWDGRRSRVLIPIFTGDRVEIRTLPR